MLLTEDSVNEECYQRTSDNMFLAYLEMKAYELIDIECTGRNGYQLYMDKSICDDEICEIEEFKQLKAFFVNKKGNDNVKLTLRQLPEVIGFLMKWLELNN